MVASVAVLVASLVGACAEDRSVEAFCETFDLHKERYLSAGNEAARQAEGGNVIGGAAGIISALGDLQIMWDELADVAPEDIRADVEAIRDANQEQMDSLSDTVDNPLGAIASGIVGGLLSSGSYSRVDAYIRDNCDAAPQAAQGTTQTTDTDPAPTVSDSEEGPSGPTGGPTDEAPSAEPETPGPLRFGQVVLSSSGGPGMVHTLEDEGFIKVASVGGYLEVTSYDSYGTSRGSVVLAAEDELCGLAPVTVDGSHGYAALRIATTPAAGVQQATNTVYLDVFDAQNALIAEHEVRAEQQGEATCDVNDEGGVGLLGSSADRSWVGVITTTYQHDLPFTTYMVEVDDGEITRRGDLFKGHVVGNSLAFFCEDADGPATCVYTPDDGSVTRLVTDHPSDWWSCRLGDFECDYDQGDGTVLVAEEGNMERIRVRDQQTVWTWYGGRSGGFTLPDAATDRVTGNGFFVAPWSDPAVVVAVDAGGAEMWRVDADDVCSAEYGTVLVAANGQLALLDGATGEQVDYTAEFSACPDYLGGGLSRGSGIIVTHPPSEDVPVDPEVRESTDREVRDSAPQNLLGRWSGEMIQPSSQRGRYSMEVVFTGGSIGEQVATVRYDDLECGGVWHLMQAHADEVVVQETIEYGRRCIDGGMSVSSDGETLSVQGTGLRADLAKVD